MLTWYHWKRHRDLCKQIRYRAYRKKNVLGNDYSYVSVDRNSNTDCIKKRFKVGDQSKVFQRQINQEKRISNKGSEFTHAILKQVFVMWCGRHRRHCDATAEMNPPGDVTSTTMLCFKQMQNKTHLRICNFCYVMDTGLLPASKLMPIHNIQFFQNKYRV